jgi:3-phenylpropionate/cinnamic acid dioxygenase small subunit
MALSVEDRLAIADLVALHGHLVDAGELDRLSDVFTDDALYDLTALGAGVLTGVEAMRDAAVRLGDGNPLAHHVTNTVVEEDGGRVTVLSKFLGVRVDGTTGSGTYRDTVRMTSRGWRIAARRVTVRRRPLTP